LKFNENIFLGKPALFFFKSAVLFLFTYNKPEGHITAEIPHTVLSYQ